MRKNEYRHHVLSGEQNRRIDDYQKTLPKKPVNVAGLAKSFGCFYREMPFSLEVSGAIHRTGDYYTILVNSNESEARRRFTGAHELAHYMLHRDYLEDQHTDNVMLRSNLSNWYEVQANKIAADILMPQQLVNDLAETRKYQFSQLARVFGVSRQALLVRLGIPEYDEPISPAAG